MISEILRKWFGLDPRRCEACEILSAQLAQSEKERRELLARLLDKDKSEPSPSVPVAELRPITPQYTPWRVRQQMLEAEDREKARLMRAKQVEIENLEKELGVGNEEAQS